MNNRRAAFIHSEQIEQYHYPADCPFTTERARMTRDTLQKLGYYTGSNRHEIAPTSASREQLLAFHTERYLDVLNRISSGRIEADDLFYGVGTPDTPIFPDLYPYATLAAGATILGANLICKDSYEIVFNPSGGFHHAYAEKAGGFCYINDVVLGCDTLARAGKRVMCIDLDAHHGNGVQAAFYDRADVFTLSFHESGNTLFPWGGFDQEIGEGEGEGFNCNLPFPAQTDDETYVQAFKEIAIPLLEWYDPDVIVLEIGMDILSVDPLTHMSMTNNAIADIIPHILAPQKPVLCLGGGGYSPKDAARGWALAWSTLCGIEMEEDLYMGLGGVFLGSEEWNAGLRDKRLYMQGETKNAIIQKVNAIIDRLKNRIFPIHSL
jgi:acetoin utilization protein AcuC